MKIDSYISELLYDHDCVIVTDLGGFIANYKPATINHALHVISPPSKKLAFNGSLKNNDGLLANHIAYRTQLNYTEACDVIREYVKDASSGMKKGNKLKIDKVGVLFFDQENRLQFLPDHHSNYLIESFGLSPVHAPVIKRVAEEPVHETKNVRQVLPPPVKQKSEARIFKWKVFEMIPAAAVLVFLAMTPPVLKQFNSNLSTMLPFSRMNEYLEIVKGNESGNTQITIPQINPFEIPPSTIVTSESTITDNSPEVVSSATIEPTEIKNSSVPEIKPALSVPEVVPVAEANETAKRTYFVIGGCFRSRENAEKFISEMKGKGLDAVIAGQNTNGLYMVSLYSSPSFNQVSDALPEIKSTAVESAWVYKK